MKCLENMGFIDKRPPCNPGWGFFCRKRTGKGGKQTTQGKRGNMKWTIKESTLIERGKGGGERTKTIRFTAGANGKKEKRRNIRRPVGGEKTPGADQRMQPEECWGGRKRGDTKKTEKPARNGMKKKEPTKKWARG